MSMLHLTDSVPLPNTG